VNARKGNEYISRTVRLIRAKIISIQKRNTHAVIILLAVVNGLRVARSSPAKNDCVIPIYNTGSIKSMPVGICSEINKRIKKYLIFKTAGR
jgi:hypothetical protein